MWAIEIEVHILCDGFLGFSHFVDQQTRDFFTSQRMQRQFDRNSKSARAAKKRGENTRRDSRIQGARLSIHPQRNEPKWVVGTPGRASTVPTAPNLTVFPWTQDYGRCQIPTLEGRARSKAPGSTLVWEIPDNCNERIPGPHALRERFGPHRPEHVTSTMAEGSGSGSQESPKREFR